MTAKYRDLRFLLAFGVQLLMFTTTAARRVSAGPQDPLENVHYHLEPGPAGSKGGLLVKDQLPSVAVSADSTSCPAARRSFVASARFAGHR